MKKSLNLGFRYILWNRNWFVYWKWERVRDDLTLRGTTSLLNNNIKSPKNVEYHKDLWIDCQKMSWVSCNPFFTFSEAQKALSTSITSTSSIQREMLQLLVIQTLLGTKTRYSHPTRLTLTLGSYLHRFIINKSLY